jgi:hypothetical protein
VFGSSSGSGVSAAADLAVAAGLWSRAGVVPISADQDTAGPIAHNVTDRPFGGMETNVWT